jgi:TonB-dependent receptor
MRQEIRAILHVISVAFLCAVSGYGQTERGSITGKVTDRQGGVLIGAQVAIQSGGASAATNRNGDFELVDLAPGQYTINISYVGFASATRNISVAAGAPTQSDTTLEVATANDAILVVAERLRGEAEAINRQKTADNIVQVLPHDVIVSLPNANVADAIGRLPSVTLERDEGEGKYVQIRGAEPRYNNVTVDGVNLASAESVRQVKLDIIPSDLVESVEINKTLEARMDGDAIGGSVNLRTKTAGDPPYVSLFGIGGGTPILDGRGVSQFGGTVSKRFGQEKKLGVLFGGTYDWNGRGIDDVEPAPTEIQCDPHNCSNPSASAPYFGTYNTQDLREYRYYRARWGFTGSADYRLGPGSTIYFRSLFSHFDNFGDRWVYTPTINTFTTSPLQGDVDGNMSFNASIRRPVQTLMGANLGGSHAFGTTVISWELSGSFGSTADQGYTQWDFNPPSSSPLNAVQFGVNLNNRYRPILFVQNGINIYDPKQYELTDYNVNKSYNPQVNLQASGDYARGYNWNGHTGTFAFGGKVRNVHKFNEAATFYYNANNPDALPMTLFQSTFTNSNYYDGTYGTYGPVTDNNKIQAYIAGHPNEFTLDANTSRLRNDPNNYNLIELVGSGYFQNTIDLGRWRIYAGLRFETTHLDLTGYQVLADSSGNYLSTTPLKKNSSYLDPLGSASVRYALNQSMNLRLAYGRGIARPDYGQLPPYQNISDRRNTISAGNPNLNATHANNYDLLYEWYLKPLGLIQGGFFYKDISDPIYLVQTTVTSGTYKGFQQTQPVNGSTAWLYGFEASYQQRLSMLPGLLNGAGISANYSYTNSQASGVPGRSDHPALQRQAPHTWNISPTYDKGRISLRVGLAFNDANIFQYNYQDGDPLGKTGPGGDVYLYSHFQVDAQAMIRYKKGIQFIVYGLNLNNEPFGFYQGSGIWPIQREYYKPTYAAGVRWTPTTERF